MKLIRGSAEAHVPARGLQCPQRVEGRKPAMHPINTGTRAPAGTRADRRCQARAAIDSTSFHAGKRPVAFFE